MNLVISSYRPANGKQLITVKLWASARLIICRPSVHFFHALWRSTCLKKCTTLLPPLTTSKACFSDKYSITSKKKKEKKRKSQTMLRVGYFSWQTVGLHFLPHAGCLLEILTAQLSQLWNRSMETCQTGFPSQCWLLKVWQDTGRLFESSDRCGTLSEVCLSPQATTLTECLSCTHQTCCRLCWVFLITCYFTRFLQLKSYLLSYSIRHSRNHLIRTKLNEAIYNPRYLSK